MRLLSSVRQRAVETRENQRADGGQISAADAFEHFADMLDAIEHRDEFFTVVRRGTAVATIAPLRRRTTFGELRDFHQSHPHDSRWGRGAR